MASLKNEVRILGLDACNRHSTLGAVVRGGLYLDGVLNFGRSQTANQIADHILKSRYLPELRFIMVHQSFRRGSEAFETEKIGKITGLPVVEITRRKLVQRWGKEYSRIIHAGEVVYARSKLDPVILKRLLDLSWTRGVFPEPVRIAHLLAEVNVPRSYLDDKG